MRRQLLFENDDGRGRDQDLFDAEPTDRGQRLPRPALKRSLPHRLSEMREVLVGGFGEGDPVETQSRVEARDRKPERATIRLFVGEDRQPAVLQRSEEHTSELQSLMRISYAVFCLKKKKKHQCVKETTQSKATIIRQYYTHAACKHDRT